MNMKKRETKQYKFLIQIWKGVKGLWKVLKLRDPHPCTRKKNDNDIQTQRFEDDKFDTEGLVDEEMESDDS